MENQSIVVTFGDEKTVCSWPTQNAGYVPQVDVTFAGTPDGQNVPPSDETEG